MLVTGVSIIIILAHVARKELQLFALEDQAIDQPKEAPAPLSHGLRRLRLAGSKSSVDLRHLRAFSRNFTQVEPPSPIMEQPA